MARTLLVVPTGHGVGLTATCLGLLHALELRGVDVGFVKPLAQRRSGGGPDRSTALVRLVSALHPPEPIGADVVERRLGEGAVDDLMEDVLALAEPVLAEHDVVVVEPLVPSEHLVYSSRVNLALAAALDADVVLVGAPTGDDLDRLAETMAIAGRGYRAGEAARVVGAVVNRLPDASPARVAACSAALGRRGMQLVGAVPVHPGLTWPRVLDLVRALDVTVLHQGDTSRRVTEVLVAAQAVPGMLPLLQPGRLVVVPGDRDDVVMAACLAATSGTPLAALLLTAGVAPDDRVWQLCRPALETGLPVLLSAERTYETATRVHQLDPEVPADDPDRAGRVMTAVAQALDPTWLGTLTGAGHAARVTPAAFRRRITATARQADRRIVLPEGAEPRTVRAAATCADRGIARCVLLATPEDVETTCAELGLDLPAGVEVLDPRLVGRHHVDALVEARRHRGLTDDAARRELTSPVVLGTVMLHLGEVDGLVAGAVHSTADVLRPALQVIGRRPGAQLVSSVFFMLLPDDVVVYGDCAVNPDPDAGQLADIAVQSATTAAAFGIDPRVAMISFSTGSSGRGSEVDEVAEATRLVRAARPDLLVDGPLQYDAASSAAVARAKAPGSPVAGRATVFVFPDLNTGNTTYKAVQRSAGVVSIGPVLQGLARPVNDLSRGAGVDDIVYTVAVTAVQAAQQV